MAPTLDLGKGTISSEKHGMCHVSLRQASNGGHLLLPLTPPAQDKFQVACTEPVQAQHVEPDSTAVHSVQATLDPADGSMRPAVCDEAGPLQEVTLKDTVVDRPPSMYPKSMLAPIMRP